jgi:hypothetical protein
MKRRTAKPEMRTPSVILNRSSVKKDLDLAWVFWSPPLLFLFAIAIWSIQMKAKIRK